MANFKVLEKTPNVVTVKFGEKIYKWVKWIYNGHWYKGDTTQLVSIRLADKLDKLTFNP